MRRWTARTVCTARLGRPLSTQYMGAKRSSSIRGSASFRKTSAQLLSRRLAFFGVTRNWDCQRLSCGSRIRNILPSLGQAQRPRPFITLSPPCPRLARGFYEQIMIGLDLNQDTGTDDSFTVIPIIWNKAYRTVEAFSDQAKTKRFLGDFVPRPPKHAFEFVAGNDVGWRDGENTDPNGLGNVPTDSSLITAPAGIGSGDNMIDVSTTQVPVWVLGIFDLNHGVQVKALLTNTAY